MMLSEHYPQMLLLLLPLKITCKQTVVNIEVIKLTPGLTKSIKSKTLGKNSDKHSAISSHDKIFHDTKILKHKLSYT